MEVESNFIKRGFHNKQGYGVFFSGCNLSCDYCQNYLNSRRINKGKVITPKELAAEIKKHEGKFDYLMLAGGEPTIYTPFVLELLQEIKELKIRKPVVLNSNFFMSEKSWDALEGAIDLWIPDFKYGNDDCAKKLSHVDGYTKTIKRNLRRAFQTECVMIRHLVLPGHLECCTKPILEWISNDLPEATVQIMDSFKPHWKANSHPELVSHSPKEEHRKAVEFANKIGIHHFLEGQ